MGQKRDSGATTPSTAPDSEALRAALDSNDPAQRHEAIEQVQTLVQEDEAAALELVDSIGPRLADDSLAVSHAAATSLELLAAEHPEVLVDYVGEIVELLAAETTDISLSGAKLLSVVAVEQPAVLEEHSDRLQQLLVDGEIPSVEEESPETVDAQKTREIIQSVQQEAAERRQFVRQTVANVLVAIAESDPDAFEDVTGLVALLEDEDPVVVGATVDVFSEVAQSNPSAVNPVLDSLLACLDHEVDTVRARAVRAIGFLGDTTAVPALNDFAAREENDDVRELAAETAAFLEAA